MTDVHFDPIAFGSHPIATVEVLVSHSTRQEDKVRESLNGGQNWRGLLMGITLFDALISCRSIQVHPEAFLSALN